MSLATLVCAAGIDLHLSRMILVPNVREKSSKKKNATTRRHLSNWKRHAAAVRIVLFFKLHKCPRNMNTPGGERERGEQATE